MTDGAVPTGTNLLWDIRNEKQAINDAAAYDRRQEYESAEDEEPGSYGGEEPQVVPHAAVADIDNVKVGERLYIKMRFRVQNTGKPGQLVDENDEWLQFNSTNFPGVNIAAVKTAFKAMYDLRRAALGLAPAV